MFVIEVRGEDMLVKTKSISYVLKIFSIVCLAGAVSNALKSDWWGMITFSGCALLFIAASENAELFAKPVKGISDLLETKEEERGAVWLLQYVGVILLLAGLVGKVVDGS